MGSGLKPPIFLIGNVRSGTSMMHDLFDAHPDIRGWTEPRTIWTYAAPGRRHDRFDDRDATDRVARYIRRRFLKYQRQHSDLRVMEKTPSNVLRIPYVHAIFPESKLLYIIREPLANLSSADLKWNARPVNRRRAWRRIRETPTTQLHRYLGQFIGDRIRTRILKQKRVSIWGVRYPGIYDDLKRMTTEEVIAKQWVACSEQAAADLDAIDPALVMQIRYEDFVIDPVGHFERICAHFELPMTAEFERKIRETVDPGRQTKWRRLDPGVLRVCLPIYESEMARHGYAVPEEVLAMMKADEASDAPANSPDAS